VKKKYQKNKKEKSKKPKKTTAAQKLRKKRWPKGEQYLEEHIESVI